jgi:hypothetical protein
MGRHLHTYILVKSASGHRLSFVKLAHENKCFWRQGKSSCDGLELTAAAEEGGKFNQALRIRSLTVLKCPQGLSLLILSLKR